MKSKAAAPRRRGPRTFTVVALRKAGIALAGPLHVAFRCVKCDNQWSLRVVRGGRMARGYWKCPRGCND